MGTSWAEVITDYAMVQIDDIRLTEELAENPALFFRKMALYMKNAIPQFNQPPEQQDWLAGTAPLYDSYLYQATGGSTAETGKIGFALCACSLMGKDKFGNTTAERFDDFTYDEKTGRIAFTGLPPTSGQFSFDFYTDGVFDYDLSYDEKQILGLCVQLIWETRFSGNWLNRTPKVKDRSSDSGNEASRTHSNTERVKLLIAILNKTISRYAQNLAYRNAVRPGQRLQRK